jgi:hypothetical protein
VTPPPASPPNGLLRAVGGRRLRPHPLRAHGGLGHRAQPGGHPVPCRPRRCVGCRRGRGAGARGGCHARVQRRGPPLRAADLRGRPRRRCGLPRHGDEPVEPSPRAAVRQGRRQARRRPAGPGRAVGGRRAPGPGRHRGRARALRRLRALRRRPPVQPHRRARYPRRCQPRHPRRGRQRGLRPGLLDVDDHRGVPEPARGVGEGPSGGLATTSRPDSSRCRRSASPRSSTSPRASARWSACTSSTRRCSSCRAGSTPRR